MTSSSVASTSRLPAYTSGPQDVLTRVPSLSALHPDPTHPAHKHLLADLDFSKDSCRLWANSQGGITVCPQQMSQGQTDLEGWAREAGYLVIVSTTRRRIDRITIELVARQSLAFDGERENDTVFSRQVTLDREDADSSGVWLEKGVNAFAFVLNLPPDMCVSVYEHEAQVRHFVVATAVGSAKGRFFKNEDLTLEERVYAIARPENPEDLVLDHHSTGFLDHLGPFSVHVCSSLFTVAGGVFLSLDLKSPPPSLRVYAVKMSLQQSHSLVSFRDPSRTRTLQKTAVVLDHGWAGERTQQALKRLRQHGKEKDTVLFDAGSRVDAEGWSLEEVGRIAPDSLSPPDALYERASTYDKTKSCVRTTSELVVEIFFSSAPGTNLLIGQVLRIPVFLHSCACLPGRLVLPDYAPTTEKFVPLDDTWIPCRCTESLEKVRETEWAHVRALRAAVERGRVDESNVPPGRKVGERA